MRTSHLEMSPSRTSCGGTQYTLGGAEEVNNFMNMVLRAQHRTSAGGEWPHLPIPFISLSSVPHTVVPYSRGDEAYGWKDLLLGWLHYRRSHRLEPFYHK